MPDRHTGLTAAEEMDMMADRMRYFIFPNEAKTDEEIDAFNKACAYQIAHEKALSAAYGDMPDGVTSFKIGDFSMNFDANANRSMLTRRTICEAAYSVLLRAGLLYRGLPRTVSE